MSHDFSAGAGADGIAAAPAQAAQRALADTGPGLAAGAPDDAASSAASAGAGPAASSAAPADDTALVRRLLAGDEEAFERLVTQLHTPMLRLARTIAGPAGAQEVVQETWAAVFDGLVRFEGRSSLKTWVFRILTNRARTWGTREKRTVPVSWLEDEDQGSEPAVDPGRFDATGDWVNPPVPWTEQSPEGLLLRKEIGVVLQRELEALVPGQRAVIVLRDVEGCPSDEVCEILGISEANQRVLLHRGRSKLRAALERYLTRG
ncbi:RNA polymerase sigma factor [Sorangium sp. So ce1099]|uniref:RNA polymerase sigma factor n=1 Tax=Sorangium sp. So ce1099 TaxID=3133331 RepID=UPI003F5D852E